MTRLISPAHLFPQMRGCFRQHPFRPHPLLPNGHLQTLAASQMKRRFPWGWRDSRPELFELSDGARIQGRLVWQSDEAPTLLLVHGMAGSSRSAYMLGLSHKAYRRGWNALLLDLYNRNPDLPWPRIFHAGCSGEIGEVIHQFCVRHPVSSLFLVGVSMGGNLVLKLLGEWGEQAPSQVVAAGVISPLCDLMESWPLMEKPSNWIYRRYFVRRLVALTGNGSTGSFLDRDKLRRVRTIREFDELVTAPLSGFRDAFDYYRKASAAPLLERIQRPTLVIHSRDDPFLPWAPLVGDKVRANPWMMVHLTAKGGHVGHIEANPGLDWDRRWAENRMMEFLGLTAG